jgi:uncharacterized small protein (DUF1192 family)
MMSAFEQRGVERMVDAAIRFANRIVELEEKVKALENELARATASRSKK